MISLSVILITYNEEHNLHRCLTSVKSVADEIVVVDSNSTDKTVQIAMGFGARVVQRDFDGYAQQKNYATGLAANDWILSMDADEELTPELIASIAEVKTQPSCNVYRMARLTNYCGKWIRHCGWYPDWQTRLYNRTMGSWAERKVHEFWQPANEREIVGRLSGDMLHYSFRTMSGHLQKIERYTELAAQSAIENGRDASLLKIIFSPVWHFISEYFIKMGILDGFYGFVICRMSAYAAFVKYAKIRAYNRRK